MKLSSISPEFFKNCFKPSHQVISSSSSEIQMTPRITSKQSSLNSPDCLSQLPTDTIKNIIQRLDQVSIKSFNRTAKFYHQLCKEEIEQSRVLNLLSAKKLQNLLSDYPQLQSLNLKFNYIPETDQLCSLSNCTALKKLSLKHRDIREDYGFFPRFKLFLQVKELPALNLLNLQTIDFVGLIFSRNALMNFFNGHFPNLINLSLKKIGFDFQGQDNSFGSLRACNMPRLEYLNMSFNSLEQGMLPLSEHLVLDLKDLLLEKFDLSRSRLKILASLNVLHLKSLHLNHNSLDLNDIQEISCLNLLQLQNLSLSSAGLKTESIQMLSTINIENLMSLSLENNQLSSQDLECFGEMNLSQLTSLFLSHNNLGIGGAKFLKMLNLPKLLNFYLKCNQISSDSYSFITNAKIPKIELLDLSFNHLKERGVKALTTLDLSHLRSLDLKDNAIGSKGIHALSSTSFSNLENLSLSSNKLGSGGLEGFKNKSFAQLRELNLSHNELTAIDIKYISTMKLPHLKYLDLFCNNIGSLGLEPLLSMNFSNLHLLNLGLNKFNANDRDCLRQAFSSLEYL